MKTSYNRIQDFVQAANHYLNNHQEETKLAYAIRKVGERINKKVNPEFNDLKEDIEIDHANVDSKGSILYKVTPEGKTYEFTKEDAKQVKMKIKAVRAEERFEVEPHIVTDLPESYSKDYDDYFDGFVIKKEQ